MELISARYLISCNHTDCIPFGAMVIDNGTIEAVGTKEELQRRYPHIEKKTDFPDSLLMSGLVNAHCHLDRAGFYSRYSADTSTAFSSTAWFIESLQYLGGTPINTISQMIHWATDRQMDLGTTCLGVMNHYEGTFPILKEKKIRAICFTEIFSAPNREAQTRFEVALALLEKYNDPSERVKMGLGPFAPYVLSKNLLSIISHQARDQKLPLQIHVAETFAEMEFFFDSQGPIAKQIFPWLGWEQLPPPHQKTPIQYLDEIHFFDAPLSLVGGYHLSDADFPRLARGLAKVIYCPTAQKRFQLGRFPYAKLREVGVPIALGTDLYSDADGFNLWAEMRLALREGSDLQPSAMDVLKMATVGGSRALGLEDTIGSLEVGKQADYLLVQAPSVSDDNPETWIRQCVEQTDSSHIQRVAIQGEIVRGK